MNESDKNIGPDIERDIKDRPSRARYDKVKHSLDLKWRRRGPQPERMMREIVDGLWSAFGESPWTWCGVWLPQPDGKAFLPGAARPDSLTAVPADGLRAQAYSTGQSCRLGGDIFVPILDINGRSWAVFQAKSSIDFDDMDARWIERLFRAFRLIDRPEQPLL
jgi:hypothetical protein